MLNPMGGTEILRENLEKRLDINSHGINLITSFNHPDQLVKDKKNVLWNHHNVDMPPIVGLLDPLKSEKLDGVIFVSNWQMENYRRVVSLPLDKCFVIENAIEPIDWVEKPRNKINLLYTSAPFRGLDLLLHLFEQLNRDSVELHIYSSTKIYGQAFDEANKEVFKELFEKAKTMNNVVYHEYASNQIVREAAQKSHILSYPCTFEETSCLSVIEAASAGCKIVSTNIGALPETTGGWASLSTAQSNMVEFSKRYLADLNKAIDSYWEEYDQNVYKNQATFFNSRYSWDTRINTWIDVFRQITNSN
jgi:glycosyltransferase involved in cell wall biosynthesis